MIKTPLINYSHSSEKKKFTATDNTSAWQEVCVLSLRANDGTGTSYWKNSNSILWKLLCAWSANSYSMKLEVSIASCWTTVRWNPPIKNERRTEVWKRVQLELKKSVLLKKPKVFTRYWGWTAEKMRMLSLQTHHRHRSTDDAILTIMHFIFSTPDTARLLFVDFSPAFNTLQPHILLSKLRQISVNSYINRKQQDILYSTQSSQHFYWRFVITLPSWNLGIQTLTYLAIIWRLKNKMYNGVMTIDSLWTLRKQKRWCLISDIWGIILLWWSIKLVLTRFILTNTVCGCTTLYILTVICLQMSM